MNLQVCRWLVFSSKSRSPYTQMFLTHIDEAGNDSPAILIENATAANRAVNIPEFVNIPNGGLVRIEMPAGDFFRVYDAALEFTRKGQNAQAIVEWRKAMKMEPGDARVHNNLGVNLARQGRLDEAIARFRHAIQLRPRYAEAYYNLFGPSRQGPDRAFRDWCGLPRDPAGTKIICIPERDFGSLLERGFHG